MLVPKNQTAVAVAVCSDWHCSDCGSYNWVQQAGSIADMIVVAAAGTVDLVVGIALVDIVFDRLVVAAVAGKLVLDYTRPVGSLNKKGFDIKQVVFR